MSDGKELHKADELWSHFTLEGCQLDRFLWAHFTMAQVLQQATLKRLRKFLWIDRCVTLWVTGGTQLMSALT